MGAPTVTYDSTLKAQFSSVSQYWGKSPDIGGALVAHLDSSGNITTIGAATFNTLTLGAGTTAKKVGGQAYINLAASTAITNTVTETAFDTNYSIPAGTLKAGTMVRIRYQGIAPSTNSTDTLQIKLYFGGLAGTALITTAAVDVANNNIFEGEFTLVVRDIGATGHIVGVGRYSDPAAAGAASKNAFIASTAVDTTAAQLLTASAAWSVASASNSCRMDVFIVEIEGS